MEISDRINRFIDEQEAEDYHVGAVFVQCDNMQIFIMPAESSYVEFGQLVDLVESQFPKDFCDTGKLMNALSQAREILHARGYTPIIGGVLYYREPQGNTQYPNIYKSP